MSQNQGIVKRLWTHPLARGQDLDDPRTTELRRRIIRGKPFLRRLYEEWYGAMAAWVPDGPGAALEIGSGAGFLQEFVPGLITSDPLPLEGVQKVVRAEALPSPDGSLRALLMMNVLHHVPRPRQFFAEAMRTLRPGGRVIMMEPWVSAWSRVVYQRLHHEPFDAATRSWEFESSGPLSGANTALPWIVFGRDRELFEREFPRLAVLRVEPCCPFRYILSGGVSMRAWAPSGTFAFWRWLEQALGGAMPRWGLFALIVLEKQDREFTTN